MATELSIPMDLLRLSLLFFSYLIKVITCSYFDVNYLLIYYINMAFNMLGNNSLKTEESRWICTLVDGINYNNRAS